MSLRKDQLSCSIPARPRPIEAAVKDLLPLRLGLRMVKGLSNDHGARIAAAAMDAPFTSIEDVWRRSGVPAAALEKLADADAFHALGLDRRQALWRVRGLGGAPLPLFAAAEARGIEPEVALTPLTDGPRGGRGLSRRPALAARPSARLPARRSSTGAASSPAPRCATMKDGDKVHVAGIVLVRQRPGAGNVTFITLEDETGIANAIVWQRIFEAQRRIILAAAMVGIQRHAAARRAR